MSSFSNFFHNSVPKFLKGAPESNIKKKVEEFTGRTCQIKYLSSSLSETISEHGWKEKFPLIIQIIDFSQHAKAKLAEIARDATIIDYCNVQFRTYGIAVGEYEL